jgi:phage terminase small subunit
MNQRQRRFVAEYLVDADRTAAARRAGYAPRHAREFGYKLMQDAEVQYAVAMAQAARMARTGVSKERVLREYARIAFADYTRVAQWDKKGLRLVPSARLSDDDAAVIASITWGKAGPRVRLHDKSAAFALLMRYLRLDRAWPGSDGQSARDELMAMAERVAALAAEEGRG